jgi:ribosome-binding protein aMBF1 (putative translation factor)
VPTCKSCDDEVDELVSVKADGRRIRVCEDCAERIAEEAEIAEMSESAIQDMMGYKGRR